MVLYVTGTGKLPNLKNPISRKIQKISPSFSILTIYRQLSFTQDSMNIIQKHNTEFSHETEIK